MIMGGSRIAIRISSYAPDNMAIKLIECDKQKSYKLAEYMNDIIIIQGDGRNVDLLKEEGIRDMDAFIALTDSSEYISLFNRQRIRGKKDYCRSRKYPVHLYCRTAKYRKYHQ